MSLTPPSSRAESPVTDDVFQFAEQDGAVTSYPIVAVDVIAQTVTVAGDHTAEFSFTLLRITGSTGNDGDYTVDSASYDSGSDQTTLNIDSGTPFTDPTNDGDAQPPVIYTATVVLPANRAVEWLLVETTADWTASEVYMNAGDGDEFDYFVSAGTNLQSASPGLWQWPGTFLFVGFPSGPAQDLTGSGVGYKLYPDGGTVTIQIGALDSGSSTGLTTVVLHHHDTEPGAAPTRTPPA